MTTESKPTDTFQADVLTRHTTPTSTPYTYQEVVEQRGRLLTEIHKVREALGRMNNNMFPVHELVAHLRGKYDHLIETGDDDDLVDMRPIMGWKVNPTPDNTFTGDPVSPCCTTLAQLQVLHEELKSELLLSQETSRQLKTMLAGMRLLDDTKE